MHRVDIAVEAPIERTPRVVQLEGLFDLPPGQTNRVQWSVGLPIENRPWNLGLIVGPSGCGKSTIAQHLWPHAYTAQAGRAGEQSWSRTRSVVDGFPDGMGIKEIVELLSSVGFSAPPSWLRPFHVLSTGQQFRVTLARLLADAEPGYPDGQEGSARTGVQPSRRGLVVFDEFTSTVDRTVAQIASAALAKTVRRRQQQFVAVTCHEDVEAWLNPDWVYRPESDTFAWRWLQRRPGRPRIELDIVRAEPAAWQLFRAHHYLSSSLAPHATCFLAFWRERPVAFSAWINSLAGCRCRREHRTVTLPDYQGVGIGHALSTYLASLWKGLGYQVRSTTTHPAFVASRRRDPRWVMIRAPGLVRPDRGSLGHLKHACDRLTAGFEYVGPGLARDLAERLAAGH